MVSYSMILTWSEDDGAYIVSVPDLPGCMADGATPNEAVENAKEVIQEWIETAQSLGRAVPEPTFNKVDMMKTYTIEPGQKITEEQLAEIEEAKKSPIVFDEDCEELSPAMMKAFKSSVIQRNRKRNE